jgi:hypothetical protein
MDYFILLNEKNESYNKNTESLQASMMQKFSETAVSFK